MSGELWRLQKTMRRILARPALRICAESEMGLSLEQSGAWGVHQPGLVIVADMVVDEPVLLASVVAHEAGHEALVPESVAVLESDLSGLQSVLSSPWRSWRLHRGELWAGHDSRWIRAVVHIQHRMQGHGLVTVPAAIADLSLYGLSPLASYTEALGNEPADTDWLPLRQSLARPAPAEFESLWAADVLRSMGVGSSPAKEECDVDEFDGSGEESGGRRGRSSRTGVEVAGDRRCRRGRRC